MSDTPEQQLNSVAQSLGLALAFEFIPWSRSRNATDKTPSLNFKVTISKPSAFKGHKYSMTVDYSMGYGHCASKLAKGPRLTHYNMLAIAKECETGKPHNADNLAWPLVGRKSVLPSVADVLHSLAIDADVLEYPTFEEWADNFGYDTDSRKGEAVYKECLRITLELRALIGDVGIRQIREAGQDY